MAFSATIHPEDNSANPLLLTGRPRLREVSGCPGSLPEARVQKLEPSTAWLFSSYPHILILPSCSWSSSPMQTDRPLDFCSRQAQARGVCSILSQVIGLPYLVHGLLH